MPQDSMQRKIHFSKKKKKPKMTLKLSPFERDFSHIHTREVGEVKMVVLSSPSPPFLIPVFITTYFEFAIYVFRDLGNMILRSLMLHV